MVSPANARYIYITCQSQLVAWQHSHLHEPQQLIAPFYDFSCKWRHGVQALDQMTFWKNDDGWSGAGSGEQISRATLIKLSHRSGG